MLSQAQSKQISGTVTGSEGKPIAGVTVVVEGTSVGTTTNAAGAYSISAGKDAKLVFSFIGMEHQTVPVSGKSIINVQMNFEAGKKNLTRYQTPYGVMMIGLDTSRVVCLQEEKSLAIEIDYTLEANYQYVSDSKIRIMVRERKQQA